MPTNTGNLGLTEPSGSDVVSELRLAIAANAVALGNADIYATGTISARPAAATGNTGMFYYATDSGDMSLSDGTTWHSLNRGLTTANLSASAGILGSQLASNAGIVGTQLAANTITASDMANFLQVVSVPSGNATAGLAQLVQPYGGGQLVGTPGSPAVGCYFGVQPLNYPTTVIANSGTFTGGGVTSGATSFPVATNQAVLLIWDVARWVIAGQQDTGWQALSLTSGVISTGANTASARLCGDTIRLQGALENQSGGSIANWATLPSGTRPSVTRLLTFWVFGAGSAMQTATVSTGGALTLGSAAGNGEYINLDEKQFPL